VNEAVDESSSGKFMESIMAAVAQLDNDVRAERTVAGMRAAIQAGKWTFKLPLGYLKGDRKPGSPNLIKDPERGPLVRQGFEMYATGLHTKRKVLETLTAAGLRTVKGQKVSQQTFEQMLRKPVYAGWLVVEGWGERRRGDFEPLVSQEIFDRVQALLSGKRVNVATRLRSNPDFPLRHFVSVGVVAEP
jgi:site-specific DNA recombinase